MCYIYNINKKLTNLILIYRKIREKGYNDVVKNKMIALLTAESENAVYQLFDDIQAIEESAAG